MRRYPKDRKDRASVARCLSLASLVLALLGAAACLVWVRAHTQGGESVKREPDRPPARAARPAGEAAYALCGPQCLAEVLRRRGVNVRLSELAGKLGTDSTGTSMLALADAAESYGLRAKGLEVTPEALREQPMPAIAYVRPGHYVVLECATGLGVTVWDPSGAGVNKPAVRGYRWKDWKQIWSGKILILGPEQ